MSQKQSIAPTECMIALVYLFLPNVNNSSKIVSKFRNNYYICIVLRGESDEIF